MTIESFLQLVGTVSGVIFSVSGLMLVNGLSFINQTKNWMTSDYRKLEEMITSGKLDVNKLISQATVSAHALDIPFGITNWTDFLGKLKESQSTLEKIRQEIWKTWKHILGYMAISIISAGLGLLIPFNDDFKLLVLVPSSAVSLIFGVLEFYHLAKGVYEVSKIVSPTQILLDRANQACDDAEPKRN